MAPRRGARIVKVERSLDYNKLTVKEVLCPICRSILIEPVTLPCNHVFCSSCFQGTMENANLVCPLCRLRIGSWLRSCKKGNKLINVDYWNAIKKLFPDLIKNKLEGLEDNLDYENQVIQIAKPGELKEEYETQIKKETESFRKEREAEIKASEALILKMKEEEEYRRIVEEEKLRMDEEIAKNLAKELNYIDKQKALSSSQINPSNNNNNAKKCGPLDRFIQNNNSLKSNASSSLPSRTKEEKKIDYTKKDYTCRILCPDIGSDRESIDKNNEKHGPMTLSMLNQKMSSELQHILDYRNSNDSTDSIESECCYFKPIDYKRCLPSHKSTPVKVPAIKRQVETTNIRAPEGKNMFMCSKLNSAFAKFEKLSLEDSENEKKNTRLGLKRKSIGDMKNISPEKMMNYSNEDTLNAIISSTKDNQITQNKANLSVKRKLSKKSPENSPSKRNKVIIDALEQSESPSSPFKGFEESNSDVKWFKKSTPKDNHDNEIQTDKIIQQVKSDYELAKKLQEHFNNSSYSTRSSAPRRGTKIARQATLDSMLTKQTRLKY